MVTDTCPTPVSSNCTRDRDAASCINHDKSSHKGDMMPSSHPSKPNAATTISYEPEQVDVLRGIFSLYDTTNSGYITPKAFEALLRKMNRQSSLSSADLGGVTGEERISFNKFLQVLQEQLATSSNNEHSNMNLIRIVEECRHSSVQKGDYLRAEQASKQLAILRNQEEKRRHQTAMAQKAVDRAKIKAAHNQQCIEFAAEWDRHMCEFDVKTAQYISEVKERQRIDIAAFQDKLVEDMESKPPKWSHELIQWRKRQRFMAEQGNYADAQRIKAIADAMEAEERSCMKNKFAGSFGRKEDALRQKQEAEIQALRKRIDVRCKELKKQRETDCKRLLQRNRNIQAAIESRHSIEGTKLLERIKFELRNEIGHIRDEVACTM